MKRLVLLTAVLLGPALLGCNGSAARFDSGTEAHAAGDYAAAREVWEPMAEDGHTAAQFQMGVMFHEAQGVTQDYDQALAWFRKAADNGSVEAMIQIGKMYFFGESVEADVVEAYVWIALANMKDEPDAPMIRRGLVTHMTAEQIAEGEKLAEARQRSGG